MSFTQRLLTLFCGILFASLAAGRTVTAPAPPTADQPAAAVTQEPFGLKGDLLGETVQEFRTRNDATFVPNVPKFARITPRGPQHFPQCSDQPEVMRYPLAPMSLKH